RPGNVQPRFDRQPGQPFACSRNRRRRGSENEKRSPESLCPFHRSRGSTGRLSEAKYQGRVGIPNVPAGALSRIRLGRLDERVPFGDHPILGQSSGWTPAAHGDARLERGVQGSTIHPRLSAGYDTPYEPFVSHEHSKAEPLDDPLLLVAGELAFELHVRLETA